MQPVPSPADISILVFLIAAAIGHHRVSREHPDHVGIFKSIIVMICSNIGAMALWPNRGLLPILFSLAVPGACLYGVCATHGFNARLFVIVTGIFVLLTWLCSFAGRAEYTWLVMLSWCVLMIVAWVCLLDPEHTPKGITRVSAVALAASLLADLPGVYTWARHGSWKAESIITSLAITILATLPALWKLRTCTQSSQAQRCSQSGSSSDEEAKQRQQMRSE